MVNGERIEKAGGVRIGKEREEGNGEWCGLRNSKVIMGEDWERDWGDCEGDWEGDWKGD